jgi:hypothetical protein
MTPVTGGDTDWVLPDSCVGGVDEHRLQVLDVNVYTVGGVTVRPVDRDVFRVAATELVPLLPAKNVEVEVVEGREVGFFGRGLGGRRCRRGGHRNGGASDCGPQHPPACGSGQCSDQPRTWHHLGLLSEMIS